MDYTVHIKDQVFQQLARLTDRVDLTASGTFRAGSYVISGIPVRVTEGTHFTLEIKLPVNGATDINLKDAVGSLSVDHPITVLNLPTPNKIALNHGSVAADVDFARVISTFMLNSLQSFSDASIPDATGKMLETCEIEQASFFIKPGSELNQENFSCRFNAGSSLSLAHLRLSKDSNYSGKCTANINISTLATQDPEQSRKFNCKDSKVVLTLNVSKLGQRLTLVNDEPSKVSHVTHVSAVATGASAASKVTSTSAYNHATENNKNDNNDSGDSFAAESAHIEDLKGTINVKNVRLPLDRFDFERSDLNKRPNFSFDGNLSVSDAALKLNHNKTTVSLLVPQLTRAPISYSRNGVTTTYKFQADDVEADDITMAITRPKASIDFRLNKMKLQTIELNRKEGMQVAFAKGYAEPLSAKISRSNNNALLLKFSPGTTFSMENFNASGKETSESVNVRKVPITVKSADLTISEGANHIECENLTGNLVVSITDQAAQVDGKFRTRVTSDSNTLGITGARALIDQLELHQRDQHTVVDFKDCKLIIPIRDLEIAINKQLPAQRVIQVNKLILDQRRWRYRNMVLTDVTVIKPKMSQLAVTSPSQFEAGGDAELLAKGTIERFELRQNKWHSHPWSVRAHLEGKSKVSATFIPGITLADSTISYSAKCRLPMPDDITIDWSGVAGDMLGLLEQRMVKSAIRHVKVIVGPDGVPIDMDGKIKPFENTGNKRLKQIKVRDFKMSPSQEGLCVTLNGQIAL